LTTRLLTTTEAAERLGISVAWLYVLIKEGRIRSLKPGRRRYVTEDEVERFIHKLERKSA
jgi:excisionase family DNA binding protein